MSNKVVCLTQASYDKVVENIVLFDRLAKLCDMLEEATTSLRACGKNWGGDFFQANIKDIAALTALKGVFDLKLFHLHNPEIVKRVKGNKELQSSDPCGATALVLNGFFLYQITDKVFGFEGNGFCKDQIRSVVEYKSEPSPYITLEFRKEIGFDDGVREDFPSLYAFMNTVDGIVLSEEIFNIPLKGLVIDLEKEQISWGYFKMVLETLGLTLRLLLDSSEKVISVEGQNDND